MSRTLWLLVLATVMFSCQSEGQTTSGRQGVASTAGLLDVPSFREKMATLPGAQIVDVRTPQEFAKGYIEGAVNLNYNDPAFLDQCVAQLDKDRPVLLYCHSGRRSALSAKLLAAKGFREVYDLAGGYVAWVRQR